MKTENDKEKSLGGRKNEIYFKEMLWLNEIERKKEAEVKRKSMV